MSWNPLFNQVHRFLEHHSIFGQMIKQHGCELITKTNFSLHDNFLLNIIQPFLVQAWHVQCVMEGGSDSWIRGELFDIFVHSLVWFGSFYVEWTDEMFVPIFEVIETNGLGECSVADEKSLNHFEWFKFLLCYVIDYDFYIKFMKY